MLLGQPPFREAAFRDVFDRQQDDARHARTLRHEPGVEQHDLAADPGKHVVDVEIIELRLERELVTEQLTEGRNVPLAVAEREEDLADRVPGLHPKRAKEGAIRLRHAEFVVEHEERLPDGVEDIEQQPLGDGNVPGHPACACGGKSLDVRHRGFSLPKQGTLTKGRAQSHNGARRLVLASGTPAAFDHLHDSGPMPPSDTITVAIIDDNRLVREALAAMLNRLPDVRVISSDVAPSAFLAETKPRVLLLDVGLRDQDSLAVAATLKQENPDAKIIVMDLRPVNEEIMEFVNVGVSGFAFKDATFDELVGTIRSVATGKKVLPPRGTESLFSQIAREADGQGRAEVLEDTRMTRREREVTDLIGEGLSNKEIAQRLNIATHTVKSHVRNVMEKLALHTRLQIAAHVHREGAA